MQHFLLGNSTCKEVFITIYRTLEMRFYHRVGESNRKFQLVQENCRTIHDFIKIRGITGKVGYYRQLFNRNLKNRTIVAYFSVPNRRLSLTVEGSNILVLVGLAKSSS